MNAVLAEENTYNLQHTGSVRVFMRMQVIQIFAEHTIYIPKWTLESQRAQSEYGTYISAGKKYVGHGRSFANASAFSPLL